MSSKNILKLMNDKQVEFGEASEDNDWDDDFELGEDDF